METTTQKPKKLTKGCYSFICGGHVFYINHYDHIQGSNKWFIMSPSVDVCEHMDELWHTLGEAIETIKYTF